MERIIGSGNGKVGMKVVTVDGPGVIQKIVNEDVVFVKLDSGTTYRGDLEHIKEIVTEEKKEEKKK